MMVSIKKLKSPGKSKNEDKDKEFSRPTTRKKCNNLVSPEPLVKIKKKECGVKSAKRPDTGRKEAGGERKRGKTKMDY